MLTFNQLLWALLVSLLGLFSCFATGWLLDKTVAVISRISTPSRYPLYWYFYTGLFFIVSTYAIIMTGGMTILLPVPFLLFALLRQLQKEKNLKASQESRFSSFDIKVLSAAFIAQFIFFTATFISFRPAKVKYLSGDFNIYHRMANRLNVAGVEAYNFNIDPSTFKLPNPYHFGDIWLYAFSNRFSDNPSVSFIVSFSILSVIFTLGMLAFIRNIFGDKLSGSRRGLFYLLIFSGLFAGINFCFPSFLRAYAEPYTLSVFNWGKVLVLSTALIGVLWALSVRNLMVAVLSLTIVGLLYINAIPAMFGAAFLLMTLLWLQKKIRFREWLLYHSVYVGITAAITIFLYKIYPNYIAPELVLKNDAGETSGFLHGISVDKYFRTAMNIFIGGWFQLFTVFPYLFILLFVWIRYKKGNTFRESFGTHDWGVCFLPFLFISGLGSWALLFPLSVDSVQFFHNMLAPVYVVSITIALFYVLTRHSAKILSYIFIFVCAAGVWTSCQSVFYVADFEKNDWQRIQTFFGGEHRGSHKIVNLRSMGELAYWSAKKTDQYIPMGILCYLWTDYHNVCLNTPYIALSNGIYAFEEKKDIETASFSMFRNQQIKSGLVKSEEEIMQNFMNHYRPDYLFVSKDTVLPVAFSGRVKDSLEVKNSDYTIYQLK